jgi:hypothetical protein
MTITSGSTLGGLAAEVVERRATRVYRVIRVRLVTPEPMGILGPLVTQVSRE